MKNQYFEEEIKENDLYFLCYMIERIGRKLSQKNSYIANKIPREEWVHLISVANVLHSENPLKIEEEWIKEYGLESGDFDRTKVDKQLVEQIPTPSQMGKVYTRLIVDTMSQRENYIDGMLRIYNNEICDVLDNYNCSAYYEPSYAIVRAYQEGGF